MTRKKKKETKEENKAVNLLKSAGKIAAVMTVGLLLSLSGVLPAVAAPKESKQIAPGSAPTEAELAHLAAAPRIKDLEKLSEDEIFELMDAMGEAADNGKMSPVTLQINEAILNEELILREKNAE